MSSDKTIWTPFIRYAARRAAEINRMPPEKRPKDRWSIPQ